MLVLVFCLYLHLYITYEYVQILMECIIEQIINFYLHFVDEFFIIAFFGIKDSSDLLIIT
jgi:hypothetical protein